MIKTVRRYYARAKSNEDLALRLGLSAALLGVKNEIPVTAFASDFPARAKLLAAGYAGVEDVDGADDEELRSKGLTIKEAAAVKAALGY